MLFERLGIDRHKVADGLGDNGQRLGIALQSLWIAVKCGYPGLDLGDLPLGGTPEPGDDTLARNRHPARPGCGLRAGSGVCGRLDVFWSHENCFLLD